MARPRERIKGGAGRPKERPPICEPGDPLALERCYAKEPEAWDEETLRAAIEMQRREREGRLAAKARRQVKERMKEGAEDDSRRELSESGAVADGGCAKPDQLDSDSDAGKGPAKRKRAPRKSASVVDG